MTFIAITYGYNQYSIFNTSVSTFPLLDNIVTTCLDDIVNLLHSKVPILDEQINSYNLEEETLKKNIKKSETDKTNNDEKNIDNSKIKENHTTNNDNKKSPPPNNKQQKEKVVKKPEIIDEALVLQQLNDEINANQTKLQVVVSNKERIVAKKQMLKETLEKFTTIDRADLKIDLLDASGERAYAFHKGDMYANLYLIDKQCYELHKILINKEPLKFDGFCVRSFDDDSKWEEFEKSNKNNPKKIVPKKK